MAEIEKWITVNGVHIPIMKGESKAKAVGRFIKGKKEKKIKEGASYLARTMGGDEKQWAKGLKESGSVFGRAIKGRAKTKEELNRLEDRYYTISEDLEYQGFSRDDARTEGLMASEGVDPMKRSQYKQSTHRYKDTKYKLKEDKPKATYSATELARMSEYKLRKLYDNASEVDRKSITSEMGTRGYTRLNDKWVDRYKKRNYNRTHKRDPYD